MSRVPNDLFLLNMLDHNGHLSDISTDINQLFCIARLVKQVQNRI